MARTFLPYTADEVIFMIPSILVEIRDDFLPLQGGPERLPCEDAMKMKLKMQRRFWDVRDVRTTGKEVLRCGRYEDHRERGILGCGRCEDQRERGIMGCGRCENQRLRRFWDVGDVRIREKGRN